MINAPEKQQPGGANSRAGWGALARIGWMVVGTMLLVSLAMSIASRPVWTFGVRDVLFWLSAIGTGLVRYVDVVKLKGQTARGDDATLADLRKYLAMLALTSCAMWLGGQSVEL